MLELFFFIPPYLKRDHRLVYLIVWLAVIIRQICKYWRPIETLNQPSRVHKRLAKRPTGRCYWEQQLPQELHIPDAFVWSRWWTGMVFVDSKRQKKELVTSFGKAEMCSAGDSNQAPVWCGTSLNCSCSCLPALVLRECLYGVHRVVIKRCKAKQYKRFQDGVSNAFIFISCQKWSYRALRVYV